MTNDLKKMFLTSIITAAGTTLVAMLANVPDFFKKFLGREDALHTIVERQRSFQEVTNRNAHNFSKDMSTLFDRLERLEGMQAMLLNQTGRNMPYMQPSWFRPNPMPNDYVIYRF